MQKKPPLPQPRVRKDPYSSLVGDLTKLLEEARHIAARSVNAVMTATYWEIGRRIVEYEQGGEKRAEYGEALLKRLAKDLVEQFGRGFGLSNLKQMRKFYLTYQARGKSQTLSGLSGESTKASKTSLSTAQTLSGEFSLSWSHYNRLLVLNEPHKRDFYEEEARRAGWSVRQLDRQVNVMFYERVALARKKGALLGKAERSGASATPEEEIKDPYVLEFLNLPEPHSEQDLESALIQHLADFLLELGYGFTFVARQKRLQVGSASYYVDLLLYHRRLRCLVAIDLKIGEFTHADAGQMNLYLNYLRENEMLNGEAPPIGLILCAEKDEAVAHYALGNLTNQVFASRYQMELPDPALLKREIERERRRLEK